MTYKESTQTIRFHFNNLNVCPLCKKEISKCETFEYVTYHEGRYKRFVLFHTACLSKYHKLILAFKNGDMRALVPVYSVDEALKREIMNNREYHDALTQPGGYNNG